jgi:hypothetical protein
MEAALAISQGGKFVKWEANIGKVFYIDTELEKFDFQVRMKSIVAGGHYNPDKGDFRKMLLRGTKTEITRLVGVIANRLAGQEYDVIVIDAIYSLLGDREENSNEDITGVGVELFRLAKLTGAGVIFVHHFSKGSQQGKRGIEKASGAGAWGRFPDVCLAIDRHTQDFCYNFEVTTRTFAEEKPFVARRENGLWTVQDGLQVEHKSASTAASLTDILRVLDGNELTVGEWQQRCLDTLPIKTRAFANRRRDAKSLIVEEPKGKAIVCRLADDVRFNAEKGVYERIVSNQRADDVEEPF